MFGSAVSVLGKRNTFCVAAFLTWVQIGRDNQRRDVVVGCALHHNRGNEIVDEDVRLYFTSFRTSSGVLQRNSSIRKMILIVLKSIIFYRAVPEGKVV